MSDSSDHPPGKVGRHGHGHGYGLLSFLKCFMVIASIKITLNSIKAAMQVQVTDNPLSPSIGVTADKVGQTGLAGSNGSMETALWPCSIATW